MIITNHSIYVSDNYLFFNNNVIPLPRCYTELMEDPLRDVVPKFHGHKSHADKGFLFFADKDFSFLLKNVQKLSENFGATNA